MLDRWVLVKRDKRRKCACTEGDGETLLFRSGVASCGDERFVVVR